MNNTNAIISNINQGSIPQFTAEEYRLLQEFDVQIPAGTNTLANRVKEFQTTTQDLAKETAWNKVMPWVVAATEIALIAATVLVFMFAGPSGFIPILGLVIFDTATALASKFRGDIIMPPFGAIFYIRHLVKRQSQLEAEQRALSQELPSAIQQAATFWKEHGATLLSKVEDAARTMSVSQSKPAMNESFQQMSDRLAADSRNAQAAHNRQAVLKALARQIQIAQLHVVQIGQQLSS